MLRTAALHIDDCYDVLFGTSSWTHMPATCNVQLMELQFKLLDKTFRSSAVMAVGLDDAAVTRYCYLKQKDKTLDR